MKVAIIGSGPTGLSTAYILSKAGVTVDIYEKDKVVGGLARSISLWDEQVELGPHFLKEDLESSVGKLLHDIMQDDELIKYERLTRIYAHDMFLNYPPSAKNFLSTLGSKKTIITGLSFMQAKLKPVKNNYSVESYIKKQLGNYLYLNFFKEYTEKLWGVDCAVIDENYAISMIGFGDLNLQKIFQKFFTKTNTQLHKKCIYPRGGMSALWNRLKMKIQEHGGKFFFSADIKTISSKGDKLTGIELTDQSFNNYDYIISTIAETALLKMIPVADKSVIDQLVGIRYRSVIAVFLKIDHCNFLEDNCIYLYSKKIQATRITNYDRFQNKPGNNILMIEYWVNGDDALWNYTEDQIIAVVKKDISALPCGNNVRIIKSNIIKLKNAFPIPFIGLKDIKHNASSYLNKFEGLVIAGRSNQNNFNYGMEEAIAEGIYKAEEILKNMKK